MTRYTWAWIVWIAWFLVWEGMALLDKDRGDTFSEHVWLVLRVGGSFLWFILAGFLAWLIYHFLWEGRL